MEEAKTMKTPMSSSIKLDKDEKGLKEKHYDTCHFLGHSLVSCIGEDHKTINSIKVEKLTTLNRRSIGLGPVDRASQSVSAPFPPHLRVSGVCACLSTSLVSFVFAFIMAPRRELATSKAQGKPLVEPSQPAQTEARRMVRFDMTPFNTMEDYQRATYGLGGPIISTVRGVEIQLDSKNIYRILDIASVGLRVYESKVWPIVLGFKPREAIPMMCGLADAQGMGKPSTHSLTVISRVLHYMICSILLP
ncbi:hypothetical protein CK203_057105 [Vitis vinifera]|uniref:Uncharacterized protein n=1 Tax=Vitis vinifera TaxID=29760 RepID=A0A438GHN5_VITVI|nr:hypothetical protein CK203_057105 [Vitis vinifera]